MILTRSIKGKKTLLKFKMENELNNVCEECQKKEESVSIPTNKKSKTDKNKVEKK